jgi:D-3-phosphoglycerate dehydrogenase / 2-oxoglutarate reductase
MKPKAVVTIQISNDQLERLGTRFDVVHTGWGKTGFRLSESDLLLNLSDARVLLVGYERITREVIEKNPSLQIIGCSRGNPLNIDIEAATDHKIPVIYTPGRNSIAAAEFTIGLMISIARNIPKGFHRLKSGDYLGQPKENIFSPNPGDDVIWNLDGDNPYLSLRGFELHSRTLGLIGLGNVASHVAQLAKAFGMRVIAVSPARDQEKARKLQIDLVPLETLLRNSDFISLHCKVTPETVGMIDKTSFSMMKRSAYIINTARASIIDQEALVEALVNRQIAGAALDVFWDEPLPANHPLLHLDNVVITPHLGGSTHEVPTRHSQMLGDDLFSLMDGRKIANIANPEIYVAE